MSKDIRKSLYDDPTFKRIYNNSLVAKENIRNMNREFRQEGFEKKLESLGLLNILREEKHTVIIAKY